MPIIVNLDVMLAKRKMSLSQLSEQVDVTIANLSILKTNKARFDRGTLIASGFIAGGALMGVVSAVLKFAGVDWFLAEWASSNAAEWVGLAMYLLLIGYFAWHTLKLKMKN